MVVPIVIAVLIAVALLAVAIIIKCEPINAQCLVQCESD